MRAVTMNALVLFAGLFVEDADDSRVGNLRMLEEQALELLAGATG